LVQLRKLSIRLVDLHAWPPLTVGKSTCAFRTCTHAGFCNFDKNLSGTQCFGLSQASADTQDECAAVCCLDPSCSVWQWDPTDKCWTGNDCSNNASNPEWASAGRTPIPPGPVGPAGPPCTDASKPCSIKYDDSAWRTVHTPHDFVVEGAPHPDCDRGHGYLCFNKSWCVQPITRAAHLYLFRT